MRGHQADTSGPWTARSFHDHFRAHPAALTHPQEIIDQITSQLPDNSSWVIDGMPPLPRNHRDPTAGDTPAATPASSLDNPSAIASENRCRCSRRATGGRPGDRIAACPPNPTVVAYHQPPQLSQSRCCDDQLNLPIILRLRSRKPLYWKGSRHPSAVSATPMTTHWLRPRSGCSRPKPSVAVAHFDRSVADDRRRGVRDDAVGD